MTNTSAFYIRDGGWADARAHPAGAWLEKYTEAFDAAVESGSISKLDAWHTQDMSYTSPTGEHASGLKAGLAALEKDYIPFKALVHDPHMLAAFEAEGSDGGYEMLGEATVYADLKAPGAQEFADPTGKKWDLKFPGMFRFHAVKSAGSGGENGEFQMKSVKVYADSLLAVQEMMKRGMISQ